MRAERLNWVTDAYLIDISRSKVLEEYIKVRVFILAAMPGQEKDRVWPLNVLASEFERMFSADHCYRVVVLERLFGVRLLICRPKGQPEQVKINNREIELGRITQLIE